MMHSLTVKVHTKHEQLKRVLKEGLPEEHPCLDQHLRNVVSKLTTSDFCDQRQPEQEVPRLEVLEEVPLPPTETLGGHLRSSSRLCHKLTFQKRTFLITKFSQLFSFSTFVV